MKSASIGTVDVDGTVLPLTREWIEMQDGGRWEANGSVLPLTREWIEMGSFCTLWCCSPSSPSYEGVD